jgi:hypothetical protein
MSHHREFLVSFKVYHVLNCIPCRKDIWKNSRVLPPLMLNLASHLGRSTSVENATDGHFIEQVPKQVDVVDS